MNDVWKKYEKISLFDSSTYNKIYKAKNKEKGNYVVIKEINKKKLKLSEQQLKELIIDKNSIIEIINSKEYFYIIMEFCLINLEEYMKIRNEGLSIDEIKEILIELNKSLKKIKENNIIYKDLKLSNILISLNKINKISIKLCGLNKNINDELLISILKTVSLTMSPEILNDFNINIKSDLWNLGIIIYYILFNEYPYKGKTEIELINDIHSGKKLKKCENNDLNDLINKMLCIDFNKRISWNEYFNHQFFHIRKEKYENKIEKQNSFNIIGNKLIKNVQFNKKENNTLNKTEQLKEFKKNQIQMNQSESINDEKTKKIENIEKKKFDPKQYENQGFSYNEIIELKEVFDIYDTHNSGFIDKNELKESLQKYLKDDKTSQNIFKNLDKHKSKYIFFDDLIKIMKPKDTKNREDLKDLFNSIIENNNDNEIEFKHLQKWAKDINENISDDELNDMINNWGSNGKITFEQFYNIMSK